MELQALYPNASFRWCHDFKQMGKYCTKASGAKPWTKKKIMAYSDWNRAEDNRVNASLIANPLDPGR
jgi:hypothetical protein